MNDLAVPCMLMRGGTSKGPIFVASDLPTNADARDGVLLSLMGSPDIRQIDGIGGADSLTSQALIVGPSQRDDAEIDYLFAQVAVAQRQVDTSANCGNMLAAVACFAIERCLVVPGQGVTCVRLFNLNTGRLVHAYVPTPKRELTYEGDARIHGVPGMGAGIVLDFIDPAGSRTGRLLPTGNAIDSIDGVPVSLVDFAIPRHGGSIASRFYVPWNCHVAHSTTGALCIAAATRIDGTIAAELASPPSGDEIVIEHPSGSLTVRVETKTGACPGVRTTHASVVLTARPLFDGLAFATAYRS